ncbi:MAG: gliding motility-associated C-terminal domain-containing protein, partial [Flavobacteriales bacterium]
GDYLVELTATDSICMVEEVLSFDWQYAPGSYEVSSLASDSCLLPFEVNLNLIEQGIDAFQWVTPDGTSFDNNLNFTANNQGAFTILLNISDEDCLGDLQVPFNFEPSGTVQAAVSSSQITACAPEDYSLQGSSNLGDGLWIIDGQSFEQNEISGSIDEAYLGTWTYIASNENSCNGSDSIQVNVQIAEPPSGTFSWSSPSEPCEEEWLLDLQFIGEHSDEITWEVNDELYFGANQNLLFNSFEEIQINASASNAICPNVLSEQFNLVSLVGEENTLLIPNVITPNGDGLNDVLIFPADQLIGSSYFLQITNRWGQVIFESNNPKTPWRGEVEDGVYFYILKAQLLCED